MSGLRRGRFCCLLTVKWGYSVKLGVVILAAGQGTRMESSLPKVLHPLAGQPLVCHSIELAQKLTDIEPVLVVGWGEDAVREVVGEAAIYVEQREQLGTGHAVLQAREVLQGKTDQVLVVYADMPLLNPDTLSQLVELQRDESHPIALLSLIEDDPRGFGRVCRDESGVVVGIVEEAVATPEQLTINELNAGVYCFDSDWLWSNVGDIPLSEPKKEYYLPDLVGMAIEQGHRVVALVAEDSSEALGINTRIHLAEAEHLLRERINRRWMEAGVTMTDPQTTYVDSSVRIGKDTVIWPNTHLRGKTEVGEKCQIGPNSLIEDSVIGDGCRVIASVVESAVMDEESDVGPFSHLRAGAHLGPGVHVGNFGEVKNSTLGHGVMMGHFSYVGDADIGANVNIGAGTVTCNYDGERKHKTVVGEGAFIGSATMLVAPVRVGKGARIGAGSVVTRDIPDGAIAFGVPARVHKEDTG